MPVNSPRLARVRDKQTGEIVSILEEAFRRDRHESVPEALIPQTSATKTAAPASTPEKNHSTEEL